MGSRRVAGARVTADGRYAIGGLPPGEYQVAVVADSEPGRRLSPAFLQELQAAPTVRVTLAEGERKELPLVMGR